MKHVLFVSFMLQSCLASLAQENPFEESFEGMFNMEPVFVELPSSDGPPPPVPLDGGLVALLVAGGAAGYRTLRKSRD
jgi:MYXO-CTERM domain-containing protein